MELKQALCALDQKTRIICEVNKNSFFVLLWLILYISLYFLYNIKISGMEQESIAQNSIVDHINCLMPWLFKLKI